MPYVAWLEDCVKTQESGHEFHLVKMTLRLFWGFCLDQNAVLLATWLLYGLSCG